MNAPLFFIPDVHWLRFLSLTTEKSPNVTLYRPEPILDGLLDSMKPEKRNSNIFKLDKGKTLRPVHPSSR